MGRARRVRIDDLTRRMSESGAPDPAGWARSEILENFAQQARFLFLRSNWLEYIDAYAEETVIRRIPAAARLLDACSTPARRRRVRGRSHACVAKRRPTVD